jgi:CSLREA domain-containing protein
MVGTTAPKVVWVKETKKALALFLLTVVAAPLFGLLAINPAHGATTFTVNSTGDAGDRNLADTVCDSSRERGRQCTLRAAIQEANDTLGVDTINFNIGGTALVKTISPTRALPPITEAVTVNGYSQGSATATSSDDARPNDNPFEEGTNAVLKVQLNGANAGSGVNGLKITAANSTIKGLVINRFSGAGILIEGAAAKLNKVEGNFIGTNALGTTDLGTFLQGVIISDAPDNTVGGTEPVQRNVLSGSSRGGVLISGAEAARNRVEGNFIGTDKSGTVDLGNNQSGVRIGDAADDNTVGGTTSGARNVISGSSSDGVFIGAAFSTDLATGNEVSGNFIGTTADGSGDLGNNNAGVTISSGTSNTTVGGTVSGAGNRIAHNGEDGVSIFDSVGNRVLTNSIFSNGSTANDLGIDLDFTGVTANDPNDLDSRANKRQNFPIITSVIQNNSLPLSPTKIFGTLNSTPSTATITQTFTVQCFAASPDPSDRFVVAPDPSGHGEGVVFVTEDTDVTTGTNGNATFECPFFFPRELEGTVWSATATNNATGDTSEFSANFTVPVA